MTLIRTKTKTRVFLIRHICDNLWLLPAILFVLIQVGPTTAASQKQPQRVRFAQGKSSATIHGHIAGFDAQDYVVAAKSGQQRISASRPRIRRPILCCIRLTARRPT